MPPTAETDPQSRAGFVLGTAFVTSAAIIFPGNALAQENGADVEKAALNAYKDAPTRTLDSFPALSSTVSLGEITESTTAQTSNSSGEDLISGSDKSPREEASTTRPDIETAAETSAASELINTSNDNNPEANSSGSDEEECVIAGQVPPEVKRFVVSKPGKAGQTIKLLTSFKDAMMEKCRSIVRRVASFKFQYKKSGSWRSITPYWYPVGTRNEAGDNGPLFISPTGAPGSGHEPDSYYIPCKTGKAETPKRGLFLSRVIRLADGETIAKRVSKIKDRFLKTRHPSNC